MRTISMVTASAVTAVLALMSVGLSSAMAASPSNDTLAGASAVGLGFSAEVDTSQATTDADDASVNATCGAPSTDASVWYAYTASTDGGAVVDVSSSSYSAGVIVATGSPGALETIACGPMTVGFGTTAGETYYVLAFDDQGDGGGNGGTLRISLAAAPPPPTVALTVDPTGTVDGKTGYATIGGTVTCTDADFIAVLASLEQRVGVRSTVIGFGQFFTEGSLCDGAPHRWSTEIFPMAGKFAGGKSASFTFSVACGSFQCSEGYVEQEIRLRGIKR